MRNNWERRVIPKWRSSKIHASLQDNLPLQQVGRKRNQEFLNEFSSELIKKLSQWRSRPDFGVAADLLNFSHVSHYRDLLVEPALYLNDHPTKLSPQLATAVRSVLGIEEYQTYGDRVYVQAEIVRQKKYLDLNPRGAIPYVDIARLYVIKGQLKKAEKAIRTAVAIAPDNRFVLRSASRFYVHNDEPERALALLRKAPRTQEDPWVLASLIAIETMQDAPPSYFKRARAMMDSTRFNPVHLAELGAALATLQLNTGHFKNARRLFNQSLSNPNDNTVAQAVWAANEFSMAISIDPDWLVSRYSSEANYYTHEKIGNYTEALKCAQAWFDDEPFSTRPLQAGAFAACILGRYDVAEDQIRQALLLDPTSPDSKNNLAFSLMARNKLSDAVSVLADVYSSEMRTGNALSGHTLANLGMFYYRQGDRDNGNKFYEHAVSALDNGRQSSSKKIALAYWVNEATLAADPRLPEIVTQATAAVAGSDSVAAKIVLARALKKDESEVPTVDAKNSLVRWEHDKIRNILTSTRGLPFKK